MMVYYKYEVSVSCTLTSDLIKEGDILQNCMFVHESSKLLFRFHILGCVCVCLCDLKGQDPPLVCAHRIFGFSLQSVPLSEVRGDGSQGGKDSRHCVQITTICSHLYCMCI